ncbi:MAG: HAD-IG family 5'-nucleotidase [Myxococcaceae bacterium]
MTEHYFSPIPLEILEQANAPRTLQRDPTRAIYTNRNLDLSQIRCVGFDMDYTLANYHKEPMETLQYKMTIDYLVKHLGYPEELYRFNYDPNLSIRGLVVDKRHGHLLKMDMHGRVWRAIHGYQHLQKSEIDTLYKNQKIKITKDFASLDTLFAMPESSLYCDIINLLKDQSPQYGKIFDDIRHAIDMIHSDGSLKSIITRNVSTYIESHTDIALTLNKLKASGKKLFLLTNSHWDYTQTVMEYLAKDWLSYFDMVITNSQKPGFFTDPNSFKKITVESGQPIYEGGNIHEFEEMTGLLGEEILYVGDHIYGDIVRSRKETLWRTCLIVDELPREIELSMRYTPDLDRLTQIDLERLELDNEIGLHRVLLAYLDAAKMTSEAARIRLEMEQAKKHLAYLDEQMDLIQDGLERRFHPFWGELFHEHHDLSRFGAQVRAYACIYTGKVTNFLHYSPLHTFRKKGELMSHDIQFRRVI